jgi:hypothetical protein
MSGNGGVVAMVDKGRVGVGGGAVVGALGGKRPRKNKIKMK